MTPRGKRLQQESLAQQRAQAASRFQRRVVNERQPRRTFLIVCGGQETEPNYFRGFELSGVRVVGEGYDPQKLVEKAISLIADDPGRDEYWCVFDRDSFPPARFNQAIELAKGQNSPPLRVAYSNQSFELWYLLHYQYLDASVDRALYLTKLEALLGHPYLKNSLQMYAELRDKQDVAIQNAKRLLASYGAATSPERDDPSTTVHLLVQALQAATDRG